MAVPKRRTSKSRKRLRRGQVLFTYLHLAPDREQTNDLVDDLPEVRRLVLDAIGPGEEEEVADQPVEPLRGQFVTSAPRK